MKVQDYISSLQKTIDQLPIALIEEVIEILHAARIAGKQVFIMGNGGSASTASHFVCDLAKNTHKEGWPHFKVLGLTDNMAIFSAYANDEGYENVFAQQLASLINPEDIVIGISASGNSPNVLKAMDVARQYHATSIGFTGFDGGALGKAVDLHIHIANNNYGQVEDIHLMLEHMAIEALKGRIETETPPTARLEAIVMPSNLEDKALSSLFGKPVLSSSKETAEGYHASDSFGLLYNISLELAEKLDFHSMLERILLLTLQNLGAASGSILVLDEEGAVIEGALAYEGMVHNRTMQQLADIMEQGLAGWVVENRQAALVPSTSEDPRWLARSWEEGKSRSALSVPLMSQERVVGVLTTVQPEADQFTRNDLALLTAIALTVSITGGAHLRQSRN